MTRLATAMSRMVRVMAARRPWRSAYEPSTAPPSGRTKKPTANTANADNSRAVSSACGKNAAAK